jgi:PAS domain S-box-containing protein
MTMNPATILVVDDDPLQRQTIRIGLEAKGFTVLEAVNGQEGLKAVNRDNPDLVLLDMRMPVLDGLGFLAGLDKPAHDLPVVVLSGVDDVAEAAKAFKSGVVDYVLKPVRNFEVLAQALRNALSRRDLIRQARQAEERYHTLVENAPMAVFLMGPGLALSFVSRHFEHMFGFAPGQILDEPGWLVSRAAPPDPDKLRRLIEATLTRQDKPRSAECRLIRADGSVAYCLVKVIPLGQDIVGLNSVEGVILDITDRVALERFMVQREKFKTLSSIASSLAHEIRNPIMSIGGFARRMRDKWPQAREAGIILEEACRLEGMLGRIQEYLNPVKLKTETCSVNASLSEALSVLAAELDGRGVATSVELGASGGQVQEDPEVLGQVIISLLRRVADIMPEGGRLCLRTCESEKFVHLEAEFKVSGNGGEPEDLLLPFDQAGAETGVPFAQRMLTMMGGSLTMESRQDQVLLSVILPRKR